jgi:hypothetical protein
MASFTLSYDNMSSDGLPIRDHLVCASLMYFSADEVMTQLAMGLSKIAVNALHAGFPVAS